MKYSLNGLLSKFMSSLLAIAISISVSAVKAEETQPAMTATWRAEYAGTSPEDMTLVVTYSSPAVYNQQVTMAMYPSESRGSFSDFCRMDEQTYSGKGKAQKIEIGIRNDLESGSYDIRLTGNGLLEAQSKKVLTDVSILDPYDANQKLAAINSISATTTDAEIKTLLTDVKDELQLSEPMDDAISEFSYVKQVDFENHFSNLNEVRDAYVASMLISYLNSESATSDGLCEMIEANADLFGININDTESDYAAQREDISNTILSVRFVYDNNTGIHSLAKLNRILIETIAVEKINDSTIDELLILIPQYQENGILGMSSEEFSAYNNLDTEQKRIALRSIYTKDSVSSKKHTLITNLVAQLNSGVQNVPEHGSGSSGSGGSGGSGGSSGSGGSFGGGSPTIGSGNEFNPSEPTVELGEFRDVAPSHWAYDFVNELGEKGVLTGYPDGTFQPEKPVSREEFVKMIVSATGIYNVSATSNFTDLPQSHWAYSFIASACDNGIVTGLGNGSFGVGTNIKREDVAVITARILDRFGKLKVSDSLNEETHFLDDTQISPYSLESIITLSQLGIINGFEDGSFRPQEILTRAQAAKIIFETRKRLS